MIDLYTYICEGGASGHMKHPFDYTEFTLRNLKGLVRNLFSGKIEDITEKIDGTNIQATVNPQGEVVFIRNKGDLNSERGGMSITDMANKWAANPSVAKTFVSAGETITKVFNEIPNKFFNPSKDTKVVANCECVVAGKTNIMPYASSQVDFHNLWIYKFNGEVWEQQEVTKKGLDVIAKACEKVDGAQITPNVIIKTVEQSNDLLVQYIRELDKVFKDAGCKEQSTLEEWKKTRFNKYVDDNYDWIASNEQGMNLLYNRWFNGDKSTNIKIIKSMYPDNLDELVELDKKGYKQIVADCMEPIDTFFLKLGNDVIDLCNGIINDGNRDAVITTLKNDMEEVVDLVSKEGSVENREKLTKQLNRLQKLGDKVNPAEGIVFSYQGKLMKLTGSFAPLNQILGSIKFSV